MISIHFAINRLDSTPLGPLWLAVSPRGLAAVQIGAEETSFFRLLQRLGAAHWQMESDQTTEASRQVAAYLAGERRGFTLPIDWSVLSSFQEAVLRLVVAIPYGQVATYGELAARMGRPRAARAVGRANATNPMPLVIPCHRVIGRDGSLHGYAAPQGIQTKAWLLDLERQNRD